MAKVRAADEDLVIHGTVVKPGQRATIDLPVAKLYTHTPVAMPLHVVRGKKPGAIMFVSAAIHGDEINGVEVIRRVLQAPTLARLSGTLIAIPIVNVYGFIQHSRYLPDRRDLNRNFPGSEKGSLTARLAYLFTKEIVERCDYGIDIHTGAQHRNNLPQVRANLQDAETARLARAFGVPVVLNSDTRDGSLREAASELGIPTLLYEAGEALRFDELSIRTGVHGVLNVMRELKMLPRNKGGQRLPPAPLLARASTWVRAPGSGIVRFLVELGAHVDKNQVLGIVADPFGDRETQVVSPHQGLIIARTNLPLANEGDALFHVARVGAYRSMVGQKDKLHDYQTAIDNAPHPAPDSPPF